MIWPCHINAAGQAVVGECTQTLRGQQNYVWSAVFSADGGSVLTAFVDRTATIWSASTGECTQTLRGHQNYVWSAAFSADGDSSSTSYVDCVVHSRDCRPLQTVQHTVRRTVQNGKNFMNFSNSCSTCHARNCYMRLTQAA